MREKELRIALVCYGGVSLAVYMHGITKEIWRLAKASQAVHSSDDREAALDDVYAILSDEQKTQFEAIGRQRTTS